MSEYNRWQLELDEYIKQGEPEKAHKSSVWKTAIGLQDVDGLKVSEYLIETAREHIEGNIDIKQVQTRLESYYEAVSERHDIEINTKEADIVSGRIAMLLGEKTFQFSPVEWINIHRRLFEGVFDHAGRIRNYNFTKKEWILKGESVTYAAYNSIKETLEYDFRTEKAFSYEGLSVEKNIKHLAKFTSDIWQIHPFGEGNTRATAVFIIKYMKTLGYEVSNDVFAKYSWYFRNALVRANYNDFNNGVYATTEFLEKFFSNMILDTDYELKNRFMHIDYPQSLILRDSKSQVETLDCTINEQKILNAINNNPAATQVELSEVTGISVGTIKRITVSLKEKGYICRVNGKRNGKWLVLK